MSTSKYKFEYSPHLTILGLIFFSYIFLAGWGTDPNQYGKIQDSKMNCKAILQEVDRVGIVQYILNGKADAPQHYYTTQEQLNRQIRRQQEQLDRQRQQDYQNYLSQRD